MLFAPNLPADVRGCSPAQGSTLERPKVLLRYHAQVPRQEICLRYLPVDERAAKVTVLHSVASTQTIHFGAQIPPIVCSQCCRLNSCFQFLWISEPSTPAQLPSC
jgi:hypothetical protein